MPPRITPDAGRGHGRGGRGRGERGGGRGGERGGGCSGGLGGWRGGDSGAGRGGERGGSRGGFRGDARGRDERGVGRSRGDRGAARGGGGRSRGRGTGASNPPLLPAPHVQAIGVRRPGYGNSGQWIKLKSNHVEVTLDQGTIYHYDGMYLSSSIKDAWLNDLFRGLILCSRSVFITL
jgi:hypothetical protein